MTVQAIQLSGEGPLVKAQHPRTANAAEYAIWERFVDNYNQARAAVWYALKLSELEAVMQPFFDSRGYPVVLWSSDRRRMIDSILKRYNMLGRLIAGVELGKYYITIQRGDITISAPSKMDPLDYQGDVYPGTTEPPPEALGIIWPLVVVIVAVVLIVGADAGVKIMRNNSAARIEEAKADIAKADASMASKPAAARDAYLAMKTENKEMIAEAAKAAPKEDGGFFSNLFGGIKKAGGIGIAVVLGFLALTMFGKVRQALPANNGQA